MAKFFIPQLNVLAKDVSFGENGLLKSCGINDSFFVVVNEKSFVYGLFRFVGSDIGYKQVREIARCRITNKDIIEIPDVIIPSYAELTQNGVLECDLFDVIKENITGLVVFVNKTKNDIDSASKQDEQLDYYCHIKKNKHIRLTRDMFYAIKEIMRKSNPCLPKIDVIFDGESYTSATKAKAEIRRLSEIIKSKSVVYAEP